MLYIFQIFTNINTIFYNVDKIDLEHTNLSTAKNTYP